MSDDKRDIRFIDSMYNDLFHIPDGTAIQVDYPDRHFSAKCEFIDPYHTYIGGNVYHICEFAELLERGGGTCRPEPVPEGDRAAWKIGSKRYMTVEKTETGHSYQVMDESMRPSVMGHLDGTHRSLLDVRNTVLDLNHITGRSMVLQDFDSVMKQIEQASRKESVLGKLQGLKSEPSSPTAGSRKRDEAVL